MIPNFIGFLGDYQRPLNIITVTIKLIIRAMKKYVTDIKGYNCQAQSPGGEDRQ